MNKYKIVSESDYKKYKIEDNIRAIERFYYKLNTDKKYPVYSICLYPTMTDPSVVSIICSKKESHDHWWEDHGIPVEMINRVTKMLEKYKKDEEQ